MSIRELIGKLNDIQHTIESPYSHELKRVKSAINVLKQDAKIDIDGMFKI